MSQRHIVIFIQESLSAKAGLPTVAVIGLSAAVSMTS